MVGTISEDSNNFTDNETFFGCKWMSTIPFKILVRINWFAIELIHDGAIAEREQKIQKRNVLCQRLQPINSQREIQELLLQNNSI